MRHTRCSAVLACLLLLPTAAPADAVAWGVQAALAPKAVGDDNVKVLAGSYDAWKAKGGFEAYKTNQGE